MEKSVEIGGIQYVPKSQNVQAKTKKGLTYCIVRTYSAGVWAGFVDLKKVDKIMEVYETRRLWRYWSQFTLSELSQLGIKEGKEEENKYAIPVDVVHLTEVIEILPCTEKAKLQIINQRNENE